MIDYFVGPDDEPDRYRLIEPHSGGGESELWRAEVTVGDLAFPVAVKVLRGELGNPHVWRQRWRDQVELLRSIGRPGIVAVREGFEGPGMHLEGDADAGGRRALYLVMEWVEGPTFHEWVTSGGPDRDRSRGLKMVWQVAASVDYLHSGQATNGRAVLHRDIKPANVIATDRGAVLVDFGLVQLWEHAASGLVGTPSFRAPEVAVDGVHTPASDRYSVGALGYFALTGQSPPADRDAAADGLRRALPPGDVESGLVDHVLAMLDPDPSRRPESASSWAQFLARSTVSEPIGDATVALRPAPTAPAPGTPPPDPATDPAPAPRRRRRALVATAAAAVLIAAGAGFAAASGDREPAGGSESGSAGAAAERFGTAAASAAVTTTEPDAAVAAAQRVTVPDLVGERWRVAVGELEALDLEVETEEQLVDGVRDGTVLEQEPAAGALADGPVRLVVGRQPLTSYLADLEPAEDAYDFGVDLGEGEVSGTTFRRSVAVVHEGCGHPRTGYVDFLAGRDADRFRATAGIADDALAQMVLLMEVFADGSVVDSRTVRIGEAFEVDVDVRDVLRVRLQTTVVNWDEVGGGSCGDRDLRAVWGDARFESSPPPLPGS